jgi:hypothetical protein
MNMDNKTLEAIRRLVNYVEESERRDYEDRPESEKANHICNYAHVVSDWLEHEARMAKLASTQPPLEESVR